MKVSEREKIEEAFVFEAFLTTWITRVTDCTITSTGYLKTGDSHHFVTPELWARTRNDALEKLSYLIPFHRQALERAEQLLKEELSK